MTHPLLWAALASAHPSLLAVTNGLRILTTVLASSIIINWWSSMWRCLRDRAADGDAHRAGLVPIAGAVMTFEARWFLPYLSDLARGQMLVVAHGGMALGLMFGIYVHGRDRGDLRIRRAMAAWSIMLALCIGISVFLR